MAPLVSVLLPYRQCERTLREAIDCIVGQTCADLELLAIDDGSTDAGPSIARHVAHRDSRVRLLQTHGVGIARALRTGLEAAQGSYIARMDGDDRCAPERLQRQIEYLDAHPSVAAVGTKVTGFPVAAIGQGMQRYIDWQNQLLSTADHARELFIEAPLCHPSVVLRRDALEQVGGWREFSGPEDYNLWLRLDAAGWKLAKLPDPLFSWRQSPGRATFADSRYGKHRFRECKAPFLARRLRELGRPIVLWGAGPTGRRLCRSLVAHGVSPDFFVDVSTRKIGGFAQGLPICPIERVDRRRHTLVTAVGSLGARQQIRDHLAGRGFVEGADFLCAA